MLNQYGACRFRYRKYRGRDFRVGTVPVGTIIYLQDIRPMFGFRAPPVFRNPWIIEAWCGQYGMRHCAVVRSLRDGRVEFVADWIILFCVDHDLDFHKESWRARVTQESRRHPAGATHVRERRVVPGHHI